MRRNRIPAAPFLQQEVNTGVEGFAVLMIILAIVNSISKSKKKKTGKTVAFSGSPAAAQREAKAQKELAAIRKKALAQQAAVKAAAKASAPAEGEGFAQPAFSGSLNMESTEGEDLCEPTLGHERELTVEAGSVYENEIGREPLMDFSAKGLLQGVVMSEILIRPAQRRR